MGLVVALVLCRPSSADGVTVAVASNFRETAQVLAAEFERRSGHRVRLAFGSTGRHYAQIVHGAPFAVFLAADDERPARLEREGRAVAGSRFTYALGRLVLWSPRPGRVDGAGRVLEEGGFRRLALANPRLAPYGRAAREVLRRRGLWRRLRPRLVMGENVAQALQFVHSGNAGLGFVALAQVRDAGGSRWEVPAQEYTPIRQQAVLLEERPAARGFLEFLRSPAGRDIIRAHGYHLP